MRVLVSQWRSDYLTVQNGEAYKAHLSTTKSDGMCNFLAVYHFHSNRYAAYATMADCLPSPIPGAIDGPLYGFHCPQRVGPGAEAVWGMASTAEGVAMAQKGCPSAGVASGVPRYFGGTGVLSPAGMREQWRG
jgi:hypothetical protein